jgi:hypothetical protein
MFFFSAFDGIHDVLLDLGIWMTDLQMLSIDQSDSATLSFSFWPIFQQQLRSVVMSLHGDHLEWCPIPFSPDVYARGHATAAQP